jgi:hypothetical protein
MIHLMNFLLKIIASIIWFILYIFIWVIAGIIWDENVIIKSEEIIKLIWKNK